MGWSLPVASYMVIIMGMQFIEGKEHQYVDYPVMDVLQIMDSTYGGYLLDCSITLQRMRWMSPCLTSA